MRAVSVLQQTYETVLSRAAPADFLPALLLRLYLAPVFWMAGWNKFNSFDATVEWFGNAQWGLGLPLPWLMAALATAAELGGAVLLLLGLGVRLIALPLMVTMLVAMFAVHWENGWLAIAEARGLFATERTMAASEQLAAAKDLLREHGDYAEITSSGSLVMLNNGIEFGATYFVMLLSLFFTGAGRWFSLDYWLARRMGSSVASRAGVPAYS
ncbi:DoxX family protein [Panacagrimonas sp.]|uniref:HvfX family Cu-binding RiPP maturation protein n=1 Tax=Panacagrimonas sp. TaxID=2480088 RepID=UPI003B52AF69